MASRDANSVTAAIHGADSEVFLTDGNVSFQKIFSSFLALAFFLCCISTFLGSAMLA